MVQRAERAEDLTRGMGKPRVAVVGSFNMDLVFSAPYQPASGETIVGTAVGMFIGGKGANQAVAAARAGGRVEMIGRLGNDAFGRDIRGTFENEGISLKHTVQDPELGTGVAEITVEPDGTNTIIVVPNANGRLSEKDVLKARGEIAASDVLLLQMEVPVEATLAAAKVARQANVPVILNPAPVSELPEALLKLVDVLVPNQQETRFLSGVTPSTRKDALEAASVLRGKGVKSVLLTLGGDGALLLEAGQDPLPIPAYPVRVVDTTAAGDSFCGALAVALAEGKPLAEAARFAAAAGALACTVMGAGPSLPRRHEIEGLMARQ